MYNTSKQGRMLFYFWGFKRDTNNEFNPACGILKKKPVTQKI